MRTALFPVLAIMVALRKESVDRNTNPGSTSLTFPVALRKESVDRNVPFDVIRPAIDVVALRKESVDRNFGRDAPKSRQTVALRKESVDRNLFLILLLFGLKSRSPQGERG